MSSPAQPTITSASKMYSPNAQRDNDVDNDPTSEVIKVSLSHQRKKRRG
jgi:hypothetical protein